MKGILSKLPDGTIAAALKDEWGYQYRLTGTRTAEGYAIEIVTTGVPDSLWVPGDEETEDAPAAPKPPRDTSPEKPIKPPKPGQSKCFGNLCADCGVEHGPPACGHDAGRTCGGCGKPVGLLTARMSGAVCWKCARANGEET